jgi:type IV secretory pathway VirB10-like protein
MNRILCLFVLGAVSACAAAAQTAASGQAGATMNAQAGAQTNSSSAQASGSTAAKTSPSTTTNAKNKKGASPVTIADGTKIDATLVSWVDARRSRVGDPVQAHIEQDVKQGGKVVLKKGTQLTGHVTDARARASGQSQSQVGIVFERALLENGRSIPFHASIVAMAARQSSAAGAGANNMMASGSATTSSPAAGTVMNTTSTASSTAGSAGGTMNAMAHSSGAAGGLTSSGRLAPNSSGVFGLDGLSLNSAASSATRGSMVVSSTKNVHLYSGTQMLLRISAKAK